MPNVHQLSRVTWSAGLACLMSVAILSGCVGSDRAASDWPQWGGARRDFKSPVTGIADHWPKDGPHRVWSRPLGAGFSAIVTDGGNLYTMYRDGEEEVVIALRADTGRTVWEYRYNAPTHEGFEDRFGRGPNATPTLAGDRIYTVGVAGVVNCLDKYTGRRVWSKQPAEDFAPDAPKAKFGCSSSPIRYGDSLITFIGGTGSGLVALDLDTGDVRWKHFDLKDAYSSPILINVDGQDQLVLLVNDEIIGVEPRKGRLLWRYPHENQWKTNISTPLWGPDNLLYLSSSGDAGSRLLHLSQANGKTEVREVWATRKMSVGQGTALRVGDYIYGASGGESATFIAAVNVKTGDVVWRKRGFAKATMIHADGKLIILDEDGQLALAMAGSGGLEVLSQTTLFEDRAWTIPTLAGRRLYTRNEETILAMDLGPSR